MSHTKLPPHLQYHGTFMQEFNFGPFSSIMDFTFQQRFSIPEYHYKITNFGLAEVYPEGTIASSGFENLQCKLHSAKLDLISTKIATGFAYDLYIIPQILHQPSEFFEISVAHLTSDTHICRPYIIVDLFKRTRTPIPTHFAFSEIVEHDYFINSGITQFHVPVKKNYRAFLRSLYLYGDQHNYKWPVTVNVDFPSFNPFGKSPLSNLRLLSERKHTFRPIALPPSGFNIEFIDMGSGGVDVKVITEIAYIDPQEVIA